MEANISPLESIKIIEIDQIFRETCYTSYYSNATLTPLFVCYNLFKGGGGISREGLTFKSGGITPSAAEIDYAKNGHDIGHMCDACDFSHTEVMEESTFRFFNAMPQTPKLNRGVWKELETKT